MYVLNPKMITSSIQFSILEPQNQVVPKGIYGGADWSHNLTDQNPVSTADFPWKNQLHNFSIARIKSGNEVKGISTDMIIFHWPHRLEFSPLLRVWKSSQVKLQQGETLIHRKRWKLILKRFFSPPAFSAWKEGFYVGMRPIWWLPIFGSGYSRAAIWSRTVNCHYHESGSDFPFPLGATSDSYTFKFNGGYIFTVSGSTGVSSTPGENL